MTVNGTGDPGVHGIGNPNNVTGVFGESYSGFGVHGQSTTFTGVEARSTSGIGLWGYTESGDYGVHGWSNQGLTGVFGRGLGSGVSGESQNIGVVGRGGNGAGWFVGNVEITGWLTKGGGGFRIDHPLAPAEKYLNHSFVESDKMKNVYDGVAELGADGTAWVDFPEWFEALNQDFRYQLTAVGGAAPNLHVAEEIYENNRFKIAGGEGGMKVCWQVTGSRKDPFAAAYSLEVEEAKPPEQRGCYLYPHHYNAPEEQKIDLVSMQGAQDRPGEAQYRPGMPPRVEEPPQAPPPPSSFVLDELDKLREQIEELREERGRRRKR